ncbi:MAG: hypothetical protein KC434_08025 [Anaerolineales bacterium]|nr:hypothetical protein [Anaerolineales bacterium]
MSTDRETNDAYLVTETASGTKIEILAHPDFPLGTFLLEVFLWNLALLVLVIVLQQVSGPDWFCLTAYFVIVTFGSLNFLVWNYWSRHTLELKRNTLKLTTYMTSNLSGGRNYRKDEVKNCRIIEKDERLAAFEGILGLRLFTLQRQGIIGFETIQGMMVRFGWGLNHSQAEEIVAIINSWLQESPE